MIFLCVDISDFVYHVLGEHLSSSQGLAITNKAPMNICWVKGSFTMIELMEPSHIKKGTNLWKRLSRWRWYNGIGSTWQYRRCKKHGFNPWVRKIPWRRKWQPTPLFLLESPMDRGAWQATVLRVTKSQDTTKATEHLKVLLKSVPSVFPTILCKSLKIFY